MALRRLTSCSNNVQSKVTDVSDRLSNALQHYLHKNGDFFISEFIRLSEFMSSNRSDVTKWVYFGTHVSFIGV